MRARLAEKLSRTQLIPRLGEGFEASGMLVYNTDTQWLLRGYCYENTGHIGAQDFYLWVFVQPLYSPSQHIVLDLGERLGLWTLQDDGTLQPELIDRAVSEGREFLDRLERPVDVANHLDRRLGEVPGNTRLREDAAYSQILAGDDDGALANLRKIEGAYQNKTPYEWEVALLERVTAMSRAIHDGGDGPVRQLRAYRDDTLAALGISGSDRP